MTHQTEPTPSALGELWQHLRGLIWRERAVLLALLGLMVLAEVGLRMVRPDLAGLVYDRDHTGGHPIEVSEAGFRVQPGGGVTPGTRVIGVGDSTTYGTGVAVGATWPLALEDHLGAGVRNGGFEGGSMKDFQHRFDTLWSQDAGVDTVVLLVTGNMVSFTDFHWESGPRSVRSHAYAASGGLKTRVKHVVQSSALWKATSQNITLGKYAIGLVDHKVDPARPLSPLMAYGWVQPSLPEDAQARMWARFEESLTALQTRLRAADVCLVVSFLPPRFMLSDDRRDNLKFVPKDRLTEDADARLEALAHSLDAPFVPLTKALRAGNDARLYIPGDYTHLNGAGHAIVAKTMAAHLTPILDGRAPCAAGGDG